LKGICTNEEWEEFKENIYFDFIQDNNFTELKEAELMKERLGLLEQVDPYTGRYYSQAWIQRNVLRMTDDEIKTMQTEIDQEKKIGLGLPVEVTNQVATQQMVGDIQGDQQLDQMKAQMKLQSQMAPPEASAPKSEPKKDKSKNPGSKKQELPNKINYPDVQLEDEGTFTKLKKLL